MVGGATPAVSSDADTARRRYAHQDVESLAETCHAQSIAQQGGTVDAKAYQLIATSMEDWQLLRATAASAAPGNQQGAGHFDLYSTPRRGSYGEVRWQKAGTDVSSTTATRELCDSAKAGPDARTNSRKNCCARGTNKTTWT